MRTLTRLPAIALGLLVTSLLPLHAPVHTAGTLLRYQWVVGQRFSQSETDSMTTTVHLTPSLGLAGTTSEVYRYTTLQRVVKVYPDGSGLLRSSFSGGSTAFACVSCHR